MSNDVQMEAQRLVAIAQSHALYALAQPLPLRERYLANCWHAWRHYAAAYSTSEFECGDFADVLERATQDLLAEIQRNIAAVEAVGLRVVANPNWPQPAEPNAPVPQELRPVFRRVIARRTD